MWQWKRTYNSQVEAANNAYAMLVSTYKEMQQKKFDLRETFAEQIHSDKSAICRNLYDLVDIVTRNFEQEKTALDVAIHTLKREMSILMETTFGADLARRIPIALCPV